MSELGSSLDPSTRRANFLIEGVDLVESRGRVLRCGDVKIEIRGETKPCNRMDEALSGLKDLMWPEWRGRGLWRGAHRRCHPGGRRGGMGQPGSPLKGSEMLQPRNNRANRGVCGTATEPHTRASRCPQTRGSSPVYFLRIECHAAQCAHAVAR